MENATKALLIAGGVLIAIIIMSVMVTTFQKTGNVSKTYDKTIDQEEISKFNENFTRYLGKELSIQQAITITNFANSNGVTVIGSVSTSDVNGETLKNKYELTNTKYNRETGYIKSITLSKKVS